MSRITISNLELNNSFIAEVAEVESSSINGGNSLQDFNNGFGTFSIGIAQILFQSYALGLNAALKTFGIESILKILGV